MLLEAQTPLVSRTSGGSAGTLVYASRPSNDPELVLLDILRAAEAENARHAISGMLYYSGQHYVQIINGPPGEIAQLWENIRRDRRHRILWHAACANRRQRIPARLPMGYVNEQQVRELGRTTRLLHRDILPAEDDVDRLCNLLEFVARCLYPSCFVEPAPETAG